MSKASDLNNNKGILLKYAILKHKQTFSPEYRSISYLVNED